MMESVTPFVEATVRTATPLALAALGECVCERTGVINVGLEGALIAGCLGAVIGAAAFGPAGGLAIGAAAGVLVGACFGWLVLMWRTDQILTGTAMTLGAYGATGALHAVTTEGGATALSIATLAPVALPGLAWVPGPLRAFLAQAPTTWLLYASVMLAWWWMARTHTGLGARAVGEYPPAAVAAGISPRKMQWIGVLVGGLGGGLGGAALALQVGAFSEQMSAGRGFIALAVVALGRWTPLGTFGAALLFGGATALQYRFQAGGSTLPYQVFLALPYLLTLAVLAGGLGRSRAPQHLGQPIDAH